MGIRETLERSEAMLCKGIDEINDRGDLNASNLELLGEAVDALKDIYTIKEKTQGGSYERYMPQYYMNEGYGARMRDDRGRYMNDGYNGTSYRTDHSDEREFLKSKMQNATNDHEREMYRRMLEKM